MKSPEHRNFIITIDGPAGSGKSTLARNLARAFGITYLDTGASYRALAIAAMREGIDPDDETAAAELVHRVEIELRPPPPPERIERVLLNGNDITDQLSYNEVSIAASKISRHPAVREAMVALQRRIGLRVCENAADGENGSRPCIVAEGRDTGTIVFPEARVKIFLTADIDERARRRTPDFSGTHASVEQVRKQIETRDASDTSRAVGPLRPAEDAVLIDNTDLSQHQTLQKALEIIREKTGATP